MPAYASTCQHLPALASAATELFAHFCATSTHETHFWHRKVNMLTHGLHLDPKMAQDGPKRPQDGPKMAPRWPNMAPRGPQYAPKLTPKQLKTLGEINNFAYPVHLGSKMAPDGPRSPKMSPRGPKMAPRWPQEASIWPQDGPKAIKKKKKNVGFIQGTLIPRWPNKMPEEPQAGPKLAPRGPMMVPTGPK